MLPKENHSFWTAAMRDATLFPIYFSYYKNTFILSIFNKNITDVTYTVSA